VDDVVKIIYKDANVAMYVNLGATSYDVLDEEVVWFSVTDEGVTIKLSSYKSHVRDGKEGCILFKDLCSTCFNLESAMNVEVTKGTFEERITVKECLEKYGSDEVTRFAMRGVASRFLRVILR
jgi:hypothetical protein